jgi:DNA-binding response OmpR family regulator
VNAEALRVLVLEDDPQLRRVSERSARLREGLQVFTVATEEEARAALAVGRYDLVVCDLNLKGGRTSARLVAELERATQPPVVVHTASPQLARELGVTAQVFPKTRTLLAILDELAPFMKRT